MALTVPAAEEDEEEAGVEVAEAGVREIEAGVVEADCKREVSDMDGGGSRK